MVLVIVDVFYGLLLTLSSGKTQNSQKSTTLKSRKGEVIQTLKSTPPRVPPGTLGGTWEGDPVLHTAPRGTRPGGPPGNRQKVPQGTPRGAVRATV